MEIKNERALTHGDPVNVFVKDPGPAKFRFLGLEPVLVGRILHLGWPVIIGMATQSAINTVDLLFVGRLPDHLAVPGTAAIFSSIILLWAFGGFLSAISVGTQAICARRFSEGHFNKAGQVLTNSILVSIVASLVVTVVALASLDYMIELLSPSESVRALATSYSKIRLIGLLSMAAMASYKSFYDGIGRVRVHMMVALFMNVINAALSYLLIFGFSIGPWVVQPYNIEGAAYGAMVSSYCGLVVMVLWSLRKKDRTLFQIYSLKNINWGVATAVAKLSFWSGVATVILMAGVGLFNRIVGMIDMEQGLDAVNTSAASIIIHVMMLVFMTCLAFGTATATLVAQSIGAKLPRLAERYTWQSVRLSVYIMTAFGLIAVIFPTQVMHIFLHSGPGETDVLKDAVVTTALPSLRLAAGLLSPIAAAGLVLTQALYGAGQTRFVMVIEFILHFGVLVPLAWFLAIFLDMGLLGCWIAGLIYAGSLLLATGIKFWMGSWKKLVL